MKQPILDCKRFLDKDCLLKPVIVNSARKKLENNQDSVI